MLLNRLNVDNIYIEYGINIIRKKIKEYSKPKLRENNYIKRHL